MPKVVIFGYDSFMPSKRGRKKCKQEQQEDFEEFDKVLGEGYEGDESEEDLVDQGH